MKALPLGGYTWRAVVACGGGRTATLREIGLAIEKKVPYLSRCIVAGANKLSSSGALKRRLSARAWRRRNVMREREGERECFHSLFISFSYTKRLISMNAFKKRQRVIITFYRNETLEIYDLRYTHARCEKERSG